MDFLKLQKPNHEVSCYNNLETTIQTNGDQLKWCFNNWHIACKRLNLDCVKLGEFYMVMANNVVYTYQPKEVK